MVEHGFEGIGVLGEAQDDTGFLHVAVGEGRCDELEVLGLKPEPAVDGYFTHGLGDKQTSRELFRLTITEVSDSGMHDSYQGEETALVRQTAFPEASAFRGFDNRMGAKAPRRADWQSALVSEPVLSANGMPFRST